jgi:hypothetical protein
MNVTPTFAKFCRQLHQDVMMEVSSLEVLASYGLAGLTSEERVVLADYLKRLLKSQTSDSDLESLWHASGSDVEFGSRSGVRGLLGAVVRIMGRD